ncbi:MAG: extracellular solute-binding protein, partial [Paracoccaceae bacterium]
PASGLGGARFGSSADVITANVAGRSVTLSGNPDYWGRGLPIRRGMQNFDEMRIEFYGDGAVMFEAFKAGQLTVMREYNADAWDTQYTFPAVDRGEVVKTEIPHNRPSGMTGFVLNTRRAPFDDWRVREALMLAFNFEYINDTITGGVQPRITSYFANSELAMRPGPAEGAVRALLEPLADHLLPGTLEGYEMPVGDGTSRNRRNLRKAVKLLEEAGWTVQDGVLRNAEGTAFSPRVLLRQGAGDMIPVVDIYARALERLGISLETEVVDNAQFTSREADLDFDITTFRRDLSLSPGNEQRLYWGSKGANQPGTRNLMGIDSPAVDALIETILQSESHPDFVAAVRALDRVLTAGRYVIPIWQFDIGRIAHSSVIHHPESFPVYGDRPGLVADTWWYKEN